MKSAVDFDITCHFGHFRNLELASRGVYCVSASLFFGSSALTHSHTHSSSSSSTPPSPHSLTHSLQSIAPHGCFSAPLSHSSYVGDFEIPPPTTASLELCEIQSNGEESYFCSRTFVIRYRDESHELNEGAHWRFTIPQLDLSLLDTDTQAISCPELLTMRFNLYHCDLCGVGPSSDLMKDLEAHLPRDPVFKLYATQDIHLQQACSGFHHYYPVSFTQHQDACLDVLLHCAITKIEATDDSAALLGRKESRDASGHSEGSVWFHGGDELSPALREDHYQHKGDNELPLPPPPEARPPKLSSTSAAETPSHQNSSSNFDDSPTPLQHITASSNDVLPPKLLPKAAAHSSSTVVVAPERGGYTLHIGRISPPEVAANSATGSANLPHKVCLATADSVSKCGLLRQEIESYWDQVAAPLINNGAEIATGAQMIINVVRLQSKDKVDDSPIDFDCIKSLPRKEIIQTLMIQESVPEVKIRISEQVIAYSDNVLKVWNQVVGYFTRYMPEVCRYLQQKSRLHMRAFWKGQCLVHTCSAVSMKRPRHTEESMSSLLLRTLRNEDSRLARDILNSAASNITSASSRRRSATFVENNSQLKTSGDEGKALFPFARGLRVYDAGIYKTPSKLPVLMVQQYQKNRSDSETLELLRRGDTFSCATGIGADVHMNALNQAGTYLPGFRTNTSQHARHFAAGNIPSSRRNSTNPGESENGTANTKDDEISIEELALESDSPHSKLAQTCPDTKNSHLSYNGQYLVVLVHGFQGTAYDMKMLKNAMRAELNEGTLFLSSKYNERSSGDSLEVLGKRLVSEILDFVNDKCPNMLDENTDGRIVFVGHSAGGLVIRKCLEDCRLKRLMNKLHAYMSLSSPHLGTQYGESQLVSTGMWALYKLKKSPLLRELALKDEKSEVFRLSENGVLQHFDKVIFVSSPKDMYVPLYSARVLVNSRAALDAKTGHVVVEMAANLMTQIEPDRLFRVTLDNQVEAMKVLDTMKNVDKAIGRSAHICYLEDKVVAIQLVKTLYGLLS